MKPKVQGGRLIVSIDIGASYSAVAVYYRTSEDAEGVTTCVDRWPGQERSPSEQKVPSLLLYDNEGKLIDCGASVLAYELQSQADSHWDCVRNFKVQQSREDLLNRYGNTVHGKEDLPPRINLLQVYFDYMRYLLNHTHDHLRRLVNSPESIGDSKDLWGQAEIVLIYPDFWGTQERCLLQDAAISAGHIARADAADRLVLIKESVASTAFCLYGSAYLASEIKGATGVVVCDAGASASTVASYTISNTTADDQYLEHSCIPSVTLPGSLQIEELFKHALHRRLENSPRMPDDGIYLPSDLLDNGLHDFHHTVKRRFSSTTSDPVKLKVARQGLSFADIVDGFLLMDIDEIKSCFKPLAEEIAEELSRQTNTLGEHPVVLLTGGLFESPYIRLHVTKALEIASEEPIECSGTSTSRVIFANPSNSKAAAIGGLNALIGDGSQGTHNTGTWFQRLKSMTRGNIVTPLFASSALRHFDGVSNTLKSVRFAGEILTGRRPLYSLLMLLNTGRARPALTGRLRVPRAIPSSTPTDFRYSTLAAPEPLSLEALCTRVQNHSFLGQATLLRAQGYKEQVSAVIKHRFLILELASSGFSGEMLFWLRLERGRPLDESYREFILSGASTTAYDIGQLAATRDALARNAIQESEQEFPSTVTLKGLAEFLQVIHDELREYTIRKENCWFFVSILQEHLQSAGGVFTMGSLAHPELARDKRDIIKRRWEALHPHGPDRELLAANVEVAPQISHLARVART